MDNFILIDLVTAGLLVIGVTYGSITYAVRKIFEKKVIITRRNWRLQAEEIQLTGSAAVIYGLTNAVFSITFFCPLIIGRFVYPHTGYAGNFFIPMGILVSSLFIIFVGTALSLKQNEQNMR